MGTLIDDIKEAFSAVASCTSPKKGKGVPVNPKPTPPPPQTFELNFEVVDKLFPDKIKIKNVEFIDTSINNKLLSKGTSGNGLVSFSPIPDNSSRTFKLKLLNTQAEKYKIDPSYGPFVPVLVGNGAINKISLVPIIKIYLKLLFTDPDGNNRTFPETFELKMVFDKPFEGSNKVKSVRLDKDGCLSENNKPYIEVPRAVEGFFLDFEQKGADRFIACEKSGEANKKCEIKNRGDLNMDDLSSFRAFHLPLGKWTMENSDCNIQGVTEGFDKNNKKFLALIKEKQGEPEIGKSGNPACIIFNMHWQFVRFTYYDRFLKLSDKISIPPVMLTASQENTPAAKTDAESNWVVKNDQEFIQCLPWLIQEKGKEKPDSKILLQFKTDTGTFIETKKDKSRAIVKRNDLPDKKLVDTPSADRLRFYDLPLVWKSQKYYCRFSNNADNNRFESLDNSKIKASKTDPITFCLDDIVLTDSSLTALTSNANGWIPNNRIAIFSHLFNNKEFDNTNYFDGTVVGNPANTIPSGQKLSPEGVYKPDTAGKKSFFTEKPTDVEKDRNYISDYADWTRLAIANGEMFDVFDKRTGDSANINDIVGARAGVQWAQSTGPARLPNTFVARPGMNAIPGAPAGSEPFFRIEPFYEQMYLRYGNNSSSTGRFDMALIRCCDYYNDEEIAINLHYLRCNYNFNPPAPYPTGYTPPTPLPAGISSQDEFNDKIIKNVNARWNGYNGVNTNRAVLLPQNTADKIKIPIVWYSQALANSNLCHFQISVYPPGIGKLGGRANRGSWGGDGESQTDGYQPAAGGIFATAHECGHVDSLPDEYNERWMGASYGQLSLLMNLPGDPFEPDGRLMENVGSTNASDTDAGIMNGNIAIRNRYFWHSAEWVRNLRNNSGYQVKINNTYTDYKVPPHSNIKRSYAYSPLKTQNNYTPPPIPLSTGQITNRGNIDLFLYTLGKDKYSNAVLGNLEPSPKAEGNSLYDGILVVTIKIQCNLVSFAPVVALNNITRINSLASMAQAMRSFNNKFYLTGKVAKTTPQEWDFKRCLIQFSPRFVVPDSPGPYSNAIFNPNPGVPNGILLTFNPPFTLYVQSTASPMSSAEWVGSGPKPATALMTQTIWNTKKNAATPQGDLIAQNIQQYYNLDNADLIARINNLNDIINLCGAVNEPAINQLRPQATSWKAYLIQCAQSKTLQIQVSTVAPNFMDVIKNYFKIYFPGMLGIYKVGTVDTTDMNAWLAQLNIQSDASINATINNLT